MVENYICVLLRRRYTRSQCGSKFSVVANFKLRSWRLRGSVKEESLKYACTYETDERAERLASDYRQGCEENNVVAVVIHENAKAPSHSCSSMAS